ncbi:unnamed protein product [Rhizophagus irregularis]|uniref:Uncharacterized protein n=2 Tax=Rhizophagus irregularis TaxID=588596 RepID=A0A916E6V9_9GLOM|nr:unnamed protein product [Rhizophagus irregularis]GBC25405.2 hypothetical protein GLOIN_2v1704272 [Rhizophagus irregularis DAOM 181602=DAOM 197198]CAB4482384.1 unnamed protein product [Rhizophagus irregularis]CAB5187317.1 unnamed protein product [Rhizophagus irregularis]CAB5346083.1 unnamed protein product [Rhizophagus irregularis]
MVINLGIKRRSKKLLDRINESRTTQLFILTSLLQAILVIALEVRVYRRNEDTSRSVIVYGRRISSSAACLEPSLLRLNNIIEENVIFIIFQIFQMWLCFNAIYNQNTIQIITIAAANFFCASFGIIQMLEVQKWYKDFGKTCQIPLEIDFNPSFSSLDIPLVVVLMIFGFIMAFLSWKLYRQFGWNIYKKIGGDIQKQAMFRTYLIYVMLLKLDLFFILGLALEACTVFKINLRVKPTSIKHIRYLPKPFYLFHIAVSGLIFLNQIIGYRSVKKEMKLGSVKDSWYFFIIFLIVGIIMTLLSLIWSVFVYKNFGQGLQDHLDQKNKESSANNNNLLLVSNEKRWSIED